MTAQQPKWKTNGELAALLFILFDDEIFDLSNYDAKTIHRHDELKSLFGNFKLKSFEGYCKTQAGHVSQYRQTGTLRPIKFIDTIRDTRKKYVELLRKVCPENSYDDQGRRGDIDDTDPNRPLDDSFLRPSTENGEGNEDANENNDTEPSESNTTQDATEKGKLVGRKGFVPSCTTYPDGRNKQEQQNNVLDRKVFVPTYPDGRILCWIRYNKCDNLSSTAIAIGKNNKREVYLLRQLSEEATDSSVMLQKHSLGKNNAHIQFVGKDLRDLKQKNINEMRKMEQDVEVPDGWTAELVFVTPFEVEDHFVDEDGSATTDRKDTGKGQLFWLKKRGMWDDDDSDIEVEED